MSLRNEIAKTLWNFEIQEAEARDISSGREPQKYAPWPDDFIIQPYCQSTLRLANAIMRVVEHPHQPCCNYWTGPIGGPGCICVVTTRRHLQELEAAADGTAIE